MTLYARVRDQKLQERRGIANPFYDIGASRDAEASRHLYIYYKTGYI